ncbi:glycosyltransferase [Pelomonas sp. KK5]|uniref:glycosyltransferase n=1 Tax=Pelomonas sp. KK5 TaxID=1855730 RepID=UPI00097C4222|nr:nucleotide disphospho-sugar-binding domain-containing protein [Pelomonas sp. KK5]
MAHIHLSWELGGGLGHAARLKTLAIELRSRGHRVSLSLRDLAHTRSLLADLDCPKFQAPVWLHRAVGLPAAQGNLAEILLAFGYLEAGALSGLVDGWRALFGELKPDLVVADYAPTAVLAARSLGLRTASIGIGFYLPPRTPDLPPLRDWEPIPPERLRGAQRRMLEVANAVLAQHGAAPLALPADLLLGDRPLLCTWPELDHYGRSEPTGGQWYGPSFLADGGGAGEAPRWPEGSGPKVFAYLKADHPDHAALLKALAEAGCRTLCYLPEVAAGGPPPLKHPTLRYAGGPVSLGEVFADGCALCVCHGGEATLAQALLAGVPLLLLPMHAEQFLISRRVEQAGCGINAAQRRRPQDWAALVREALDAPAWREGAQHFARAHAGFTQQGLAARLADAFEETLS